MVDNSQDSTINSGGNHTPTSSGNLVARKQDPLIGTVFAERYTILEVLGRGGMGVVYKARHDLMDRTVAIKMMLPQLVSDDVSLARFQREARAASRINHPNIIAIHDFGMTNDTGVAYLVMDYIEGCDLGDLIKAEKQIGVQRAAKIFMQVCDALSHAHKIGVVHRDLKPSNIMLLKQPDAGDFAKVLDFGVAKLSAQEGEIDEQKLTTTGEVFGSPVYMSPEQCSGDKLDARSDIYALGCVMYEALTGKPPCAGKTPIETIAKHMTQMPDAFAMVRPDLYIPDWMERLVFKALAKDPNKRQQSMQQVLEELQAGIGKSSATKVQPLASAQPVSPAPSNHSRMIWIGALVGFLVAALTTIGVMFAMGRFTPTAVNRAVPATNRTGDAMRRPVVEPKVEPKVEAKVEPKVEATIAPTTNSKPERPKPQAAKVHRSTAKRENVTAVHDDPPPAATPSRKHSRDYFDYAVKHEQTGAPVDVFRN